MLLPHLSIHRFLCCVKKKPICVKVKWDSWKNLVSPHLGVGVELLQHNSFQPMKFFYTTQKKSKHLTFVSCLHYFLYRFCFMSWNPYDTETNFRVIETFYFCCHRMKICFRVPLALSSPRKHFIFQKTLCHWTNRNFLGRYPRRTDISAIGLAGCFRQNLVIFVKIIY